MKGVHSYKGTNPVLGGPTLRRTFLVAQSLYEVCLQCRRPRFNPSVGKIPWRRKWQPTPVFLPGESHGQRSLAGYTVRGVARVGHD